MKTADIVPGKTVIWSFLDGKAEVSYKGIVLSCDGKIVEIRTEAGKMKGPVTCGTWNLSKEALELPELAEGEEIPDVVDIALAPSTESATKAEKVVGQPKGPRAGTKSEAATALFSSMTAKGKSRKDIIAAFISDVGLTPAGANTYYANCKNKAGKVTVASLPVAPPADEEGDDESDEAAAE